MRYIIAMLFIIVTVVTVCLAVDNRLVTFSVKESLAEGWKGKVDEAVCELMGETNITHKCIWQVYTNSTGERWQACTFWNDYQFGQKPITNIEAILDIKIPRPFRDDVTITIGVPQDRGLYPVTNGVAP
jgi:hypothetical protein